MTGVGTLLVFINIVAENALEDSPIKHYFNSKDNKK